MKNLIIKMFQYLSCLILHNEKLQQFQTPNTEEILKIYFIFKLQILFFLVRLTAIFLNGK